MRLPLCAAILAATASPIAFAQTADTTCQRMGVYTNCSTTYRDAPSPDRFRLDPPDIAGSFERGRAQARQRKAEEAQIEQMRLQNELLRRQLDEQNRMHQRKVAAENRALAELGSCTRSFEAPSDMRQCIAESYVRDPLVAEGLDSFLAAPDTPDLQFMKEDLAARVFAIRLGKLGISAPLTN